MYFFRFSLCIFESDTVKSDCPVQILRKMIKYLKIYYRFTSFTVSGDIKKKKKKKAENIKKEKKSSENDQLTGHFQSFFIYFFSSPPPPPPLRPLI